MQKSGRVVWLVLAVAALLVSLTVSCSKPQDVQAGALKTSDAPTVAVVKATREDLSSDLVLTAEFRPFQEIDVMAKVAGYVKVIYVDVGDRVKLNQPLAVLEVPEMADDRARAQAGVDRGQAEVARAKDQLQQAQSSHDIAHLSYTRLAEVSKQKPGLVAQQEIDDAHGKDLVAEAQVSGARSNLIAAEQQVQVNTAELQKVKTMFEYTKVTAPFAGVVTKRFADTGSMIQAGTASNTQVSPLVRLSENSLLRLTLPVPESAVPTVHVGQNVDVRVPTLNRSFPGRVARFSDKVTLATRTMDTEVDVPNANLVLIPGMYAEVHLTLDRRNHVITIPVTAVDVGNDDGGSHKATTGTVAVITVENKVEMRKVELGLETANRVEIRSGITEGEMVVIGSRSGLQAGQDARPKVTSMTSP
jgi:RND family efflux transporter MFP subunit